MGDDCPGQDEGGTWPLGSFLAALLPAGCPPPPTLRGTRSSSCPQALSQFLPLVRGVSEAGRARTPCPRACCGGPQPLMFFGLKVAGTGLASDGQAWEVGLRSVPCGRGLRERSAGQPGSVPKSWCRPGPWVTAQRGSRGGVGGCLRAPSWGLCPPDLRFWVIGLLLAPTSGL